MGEDTYICQLSGPATGGDFYFNVDPATYLPDGTESILAENEGGFIAVESVDSFIGPSSTYVYAPGWFNWSTGYMDLETYSWGLSDRTATTDFYYGISQYDPDDNGWILQEPTTIKWRRCNDFPNPSKDFIRDLDEQGGLTQTPNAFLFYEPPRNKDWKLMVNDSFVFKTTEGRYGYIWLKSAGAGSAYCYYKLYSLWDGLGG
jgi:hypothetical protein